jgi:nucleoside-diphosphate kinase
MEQTFVLIKPSALIKGVVGEIIGRFEHKTMKIVALKMLQMTRNQAKELYRGHESREYFDDLIHYLTSASVIAMIVEGHNAIHTVRQLVGVTNPQAARPGTIRGDFGNSILDNLIHASDSHADVDKEIALFFN